MNAPILVCSYCGSEETGDGIIVFNGALCIEDECSGAYRMAPKPLATWDEAALDTVFGAVRVSPTQPECVIIPPKQNVCAEALALTGNGGERNDSYDHPLPNFTKIGQMWSILVGVVITAEQVALMMTAMKLVRQNHKAKRDNLVDGIGYLRCIERFDEYPQGYPGLLELAEPAVAAPNQ